MDRTDGLARRPRGGSWARPGLVLFDRDGTLIVDVPYNTDPTRVTAMPGAARTLSRLRAAGIAVGVVSNQSGVGRGLISPAQLAAVNAEVERLLGPFAWWGQCVHAPQDQCSCRKPRPGLVLAACRHLGIPPAAVVVVGDIGSDVECAMAAGARAILVPTPETRAEEVAAAPVALPNLDRAGDALLGGWPK